MNELFKKMRGEQGEASGRVTATEALLVRLDYGNRRCDEHSLSMCAKDKAEHRLSLGR